LEILKKPFFWLAVGGTFTAIVLVVKKTRAAPLLPTAQIYGETTRVALAVPSDWRRVTGTEVGALPELGVQANALRSSSGFTTMQYGTLAPFTASDGNTYATWIEQHYHEPGGAVRPWGLHHGVTVLAQAN
jgi:hypothetical protein